MEAGRNQESSSSFPCPHSEASLCDNDPKESQSLPAEGTPYMASIPIQNCLYFFAQKTPSSGFQEENFLVNSGNTISYSPIFPSSMFQAAEMYPKGVGTPPESLLVCFFCLPCCPSHVGNGGEGEIGCHLLKNADGNFLFLWHPQPAIL